tara:strand:- start:494 stop:667 length:174 start_codon:yes stop_codon:yes gene_type:complete
MNHNTEQELITAANNQGASFTTISDVINFFINDAGWTEEQAKTHLRESFPNVTDWSF